MASEQEPAPLVEPQIVEITAEDATLEDDNEDEFYTQLDKVPIILSFLKCKHLIFPHSPNRLHRRNE
jgi:hypothetical protein